MLKTAHLALGGALLLSSATAQAQVSQAPTAPISSVTSLRVLGAPGLRREAGTWLFNDSMFVSPGTNVGAPGAPAFLANLRRDKKEKLPFLRATTVPLNWVTLPLPTLRDLMAPGYDFTALQVSLAAQVSTATAQSHVYVGWSLPVGSGAILTKAAVTPIIAKLRTTLDAVAPGSALVLEADATLNPLVSVSDVDAAASLCDAVLLRVDPTDEREIWPLKMARRNVEEQPDFDLPIFVTYNGAVTTPGEFDARTLEYLMGGATGFVMDETPTWAPVLTKNAGLFANAVTLEDAGILPSQNPITLQIADLLRSAGRIPLVGRLPEDGKNGESIFVVLDDRTSLATLDSLDKSMRSGASVYLEGLPDLTNKALVDKLADITSTKIEILPTPRSESLNLDDPWVFGDARGREFDVSQRVKWTLKASLAGQTKVQKGEDSNLPFAAAKLANDPNGLLIAPLGKGRVLWLPSVPIGKDPAPRRAFYSAIAGHLQASMVEWKFPTVEDEVRNGGQLRVAMRGSKVLTPMVALWNDAPTDATITLNVRGDSAYVLDMPSDKVVPSTVVGYASILKVTIPAHGFVWSTFGKTKADLDKERLAGRPKARVVKDKK